MRNISPHPGSKGHRKKRVGRGFSSGIGGRSTRGTKGQKARKSGNVRLGFEGGQMPLYRKVGKYGFNNKNFRKKVKAINLRSLEYFPNVKDFSLEMMLELGIIKKKDKFVKFIGDSFSFKNISISAHSFSKKAKEINEKNKNTINIIN